MPTTKEFTLPICTSPLTYAHSISKLFVFNSLRDGFTNHLRLVNQF